MKNDQLPRSMSLDEKEIERHFLMFENVAKDMDWRTDMYCFFLLGVLTGKAKDVYCALSTPQCADHDLLKKRIPQAYKLVSEAHHQKLRKLVK